VNAAAALLDEQVVAGAGHRTALISPEGRVTYQELQGLSQQTAALFAALGVTLENRVAFCLPDGIDWASCFFGAIRLGAVAVPISMRLQSREYAAILRDSRARVLVLDSQMLPLFAEAIRERPFLQHLLLVGQPQAGYPSFTALRDQSPGSFRTPLLSPDDVAFWLYTSGTTGTPKGVVHLHRNCLASAPFARGVLDLRPDDIPFATSKLFFAYALGNILLAPRPVGAASLVYPGRPTPREILAYIKEHRPTLFFSVPSFYAALLELDDVPADALASLRLCVSAGETLPAAIYERWVRRFGLPILDGIGCSETIYTFISNRPGAVRPGSTGQVVPGFAVRLVDADGRDVPAGESGALLVKAPSCCAGYWNQRELTRQSLQGEWLRTGDVMRRDADGFFYYLGRNDDLWKVNGEWVAPAMVEQAVLEHPAVREVAVAKVPNEQGLEKPIAFVVPRAPQEAGPALAAELLQFAADRLTPNRRPRQVVFVDELPRTATGKVQRFKLRQRVC
jgi:benzoate-CoA ligase family protein